MAATKDCIPVARFLSPATFRHYPAKAAHGPWHAPDVRHGTAHLYRTRLREASRGQPDFAGRYKIVSIGCGAGTVCPAIVNKATGQVHFVPAFRSVGWVLSDFTGAKKVERLNYRRDSRLLVILGMRNETERTGGVTLYDWRDGRPHLVRFVPAARLCQENEA
jgi:hypothetical protein